MWTNKPLSTMMNRVIGFLRMQNEALRLCHNADETGRLCYRGPLGSQISNVNSAAALVCSMWAAVLVIF